MAVADGIFEGIGETVVFLAACYSIAWLVAAGLKGDPERDNSQSKDQKDISGRKQITGGTILKSDLR